MLSRLVRLIERRSSLRRARIVEARLTHHRDDPAAQAAALKQFELMGWIDPPDYDDRDRVIGIRLRRSRWTSRSEVARAWAVKGWDS